MKYFYGGYNPQIDCSKHMEFIPPADALRTKYFKDKEANCLPHGWGGISGMILNEDVESFRKIMYQIRPDLVERLVSRRNINFGKVSLLQSKVKNIARKSLKRGFYSSSKSGKTPHSKSSKTPRSKPKNKKPSINILDKLLKATIVNKVAMTQKKLGTEEEEIPQMLTFSAFKSKLIESFKEGRKLSKKPTHRMTNTDLTVLSDHTPKGTFGEEVEKLDGERGLNDTKNFLDVHFRRCRFNPRIEQSVVSDRMKHYESLNSSRNEKAEKIRSLNHTTAPRPLSKPILFNSRNINSTIVRLNQVKSMQQQRDKIKTPIRKVEPRKLETSSLKKVSRPILSQNLPQSPPPIPKLNLPEHTLAVGEPTERKTTVRTKTTKRAKRFRSVGHTLSPGARKPVTREGITFKLQRYL